MATNLVTKLLKASYLYSEISLDSYDIFYSSFLYT